MLAVSNPSGSDNATVSVVHRPALASQWIDLGPLTPEPRTLKAGDQVSVRTVLNNGQDVFSPTPPFVVTAATAAANAWPFALAQAVNPSSASVRIGVLTAQNEVVPVQDATANRAYALRSSNAVSGFLQVVSAASGLTSRIATVNDWGSGYCANLIVTNQSAQPVSWNVTETVQGTINNMWNAIYTQSGSQLTARGVAWNAVLQPGQSTHSVGFCANR